MHGVTANRRGRVRRGQALIETCLAVMMLCLILFGLLQISQLFAAREILQHAANRGARARTVGFNDFMVQKCARVAAIPVSGRLLEPVYTHADPALRAMLATMRAGELWDAVLSDAVPPGTQAALELARIPDYLASENWAQARWILDYEYWDGGLRASYPSPALPGTALMPVTVRHDVRLWVPMHRTFYAADSVTLRAETRIENHYPLYLEDQGW